MNCLAGYSPERILSVLNQFTDVDYCIPSCQMVWQTLLACLLLCYNILTTMELGFFSLRLVWDSLLPSPTLYNDVQIVVPILVDNIWCAYMFNTHGANVYVLDPAHAAACYPVHAEIHKLLHDSLANCLDRFFEGWYLKPISCWNLEYPALGLGNVTPYVLLTWAPIVWCFFCNCTCSLYMLIGMLHFSLYILLQWWFRHCDVTLCSQF